MEKDGSELLEKAEHLHDANFSHKVSICVGIIDAMRKELMNRKNEMIVNLMRQ